MESEISATEIIGGIFGFVLMLGIFLGVVIMKDDGNKKEVASISIEKPVKTIQEIK